jgi:hypothetical protein
MQTGAFNANVQQECAVTGGDEVMDEQTKTMMVKNMFKAVAQTEGRSFTQMMAALLLLRLGSYSHLPEQVRAVLKEAMGDE